MDKHLLELAKLATHEGWDAFRIMSEMIAYQKEKDAEIATTAGYSDVAELIRIQ